MDGFLPRETFDRQIKNYNIIHFQLISPRTKTHKDCAEFLFHEQRFSRNEEVMEAMIS